MRIVHFELPADDPARCMRFYQRAFGWTFEEWGGLMAREAPGQPATNVVAVPSVDESAKAIAAAGGTQTAPKMAVPGIGWTAYFTDTEGTPFGVMQFDPNAK